jgi:hypothetical protein
MTNPAGPKSEGEHILYFYRWLYDAILGALRNLSEEELNWKPPVPESNSLYVIAYHAASSSLWWLNVAQGNVTERDRLTEFSAKGPFSIREEHFTAWLSAAEHIIPGLTDYEAVHILPPGVGTTRTEGSCTTRWALLHIIDHLSIHLGHIEITRQWYECEKRTESIH